MKIELFPGIHLGYSNEPIEFTESVKPLEASESQILPFRYPENATCDGAIFVMPPFTQIAPGKIGQGTKVEFKVTHGSGLCPRTHDLYGDGRLAVTWQHINHNAGFSFDEGDIYCLYAGPDGLIVQTRTTPPYRPNISEIILQKNDPRAPKAFWKILQDPYPDPRTLDRLFPPLPCP